MDELEEVTQRFKADFGDYAAPMEAAEAETEELSGAVDELTGSLDVMRESAASARDDLAEVAEVAGRTRDEVGGLGGAAGEAGAELDDLAVQIQGSGVVADEAFIGAKEAMDAYRDSIAEVAVALAAVDTEYAAMIEESGLADVAVAAEGAATGLEKAGQAAEQAGPEIGAMQIGMAAGVAALAPVAAGFVAAAAAIAAAAVLAVPDVVRLYDVVTGTAKAPGSGPIAEAAAEIKELEQDFRSISRESGVGKSLLGDLPVVLDATEKALRDVVPLARAGAVSFRDIADAVDKGVSSSGFTDFLRQTASFAPQDTEALIRLGGTLTDIVGGALEDLAPQAAADTDAISRLAGEVGGPLDEALATAGSGMHGLTGGFQEVLDPVEVLLGPVAGLVGGLHNLEAIAASAGHTIGVFLGGPLSIMYDLAQKARAALGLTGDAAKKTGADVQAAGAEVTATAAPVEAWAKAMGGAADDANSLAGRVKDLTTALSDEGDATSGALGSIAQFHQELITVAQDMQASGDKAGYLTKAQLATAAAFATLYDDAKNASAGILQTTGSADKAAGPLEAMRAEMQRIQDPTAAEAQLLRDLNAEIAALHSKTITIGVRQVDEGGGGQPLPVGGGPTGHPQGGPDTASMIPALASAAIGGGRLLAGGGSPAGPMSISVPLTLVLSADTAAVSQDPRLLQAIQQAVQEAVARYALSNGGNAGLTPVWRHG